MMPVIKKDNQTLKYEIKRKPILRTYFKVKKDYVLITTNYQAKEDDIKAFLVKNFANFLRIITENMTEKPFTLWGKEHELIFIESAHFHYQIAGNIIYVYKSKSDDEAIRRLLKEETIKMYEIFENELINNLKNVGLNIVKMHYRFLKSRYGSCNIKLHEITINTFLAKIDPIYLKYVLYHEYAHLLIPNHQSAFYQLLDLFMINHKEIQKRLKKIAIY